MKKWFSSVPDAGFTSLIGAGNVINGSIIFAGTLRVEGTINGDVSPIDLNNANLIVDNGGTIIAQNIRTHDATINSQISAKTMIVDNSVTIGEKAVLTDITIHYRTLEIKLGAKLNNCTFIDLNASGNSPNSDQSITPSA